MADYRRADDTVSEELAGLGQRVKGAAKDVAGNVTGDRALEREGERDKAEGRARQATNDVFDETDGVRGRTVRDDSTLVTGLYTTPDMAGRAYQDLTTKHGYKPDEVSVLMSDETRKRHFGDVTPGREFHEGSKAAEGAGVGGGIGLGVGAALGALLAVGTSIVLPGIGLVVAGPLAGAMAGAGVGGATGSILGALVGAGIPEERAVMYERGLRDGGIVVGTRARDAQHAADLQRDYQTWGGQDIR